MISDKRKEEIKESLKDCIEEAFSYNQSGSDVSLVYDSIDNYFTSLITSSSGWESQCLVELVTIPTINLDWSDALFQPYEDELQCMITGSPYGEFEYSQDIIDKARKIIDDEEIDILDHDEAKYVLEKCEASEFILQEEIKVNVGDYMENNFDKLLDKAIEAYESKVANI